MRYTITGTIYHPDIDIVEEHCNSLQEAMIFSNLFVEDRFAKVSIKDNSAKTVTQVYPPLENKSGNGRGFADQYIERQMR